MRNPGSVFFVACTFVILAAEPGAAEPDAALRTDYKYAWPREDQLVLDGPWQLACTDVPEQVALPENLEDLDWFNVELPTEVHWALYRAKRAGHPYVGRNAADMRWVEDKAWWFRKRFALPKSFRGKYVRLMVEGTDDYGHYWLNGKYLGRSEGAFGAAKMPVDDLRTSGQNELVVRVECGGYKLGKKGGAPQASLVKSELWSGWRLGAYDLNTVGIWQPLRLVATGWPCLERPFNRQRREALYITLKDAIMNVRTPLTMAAVLAAVVAAGRPANAGLPENYLRRWDDPAVQKRIGDGIEKNRKSDAVLQIVGPSGRPVAGADVKITQKSHEFLFGCNIFVLGQMKKNDHAYEDAFLKLFNFATVPFYWGDLEPDQGKPRFAEGSPYIWRRPPPDRVVAFGNKHGLTLKGHPLLWHSINPEWIPKDPDELKRLYRKRFKEIADRYAKDIPIWDGVNESLVCPPHYPLFSAENRDDPPYVLWAFAEEQRVFRPENVLMINDVTVFNWPSNETNRFYRQCTRLLENGARIEGIGFQFHFFSRKSLDAYVGGERCDPGTLLDTYEMFATLGLPLWITEITMGSAGEDGLEIQRRVVRDMYRLWFSTPNMAGITWWNLGDGTAYRNEGLAGGGLADNDLNPKPAYKALDQLINHDWKTNLETKSDAQGNVKFRGFNGTYEVEVTAGGKTKKFEVAVGSGGPAKETLTMP